MGHGRGGLVVLLSARSAGAPRPLEVDPGWSGVLLYLPMTDDLLDAAGVADPTAHGAPIITTDQSQFGDASAQFGGDGSGDYLSLPFPYAPATGDFTIEAWCRRTDYPLSAPDFGVLFAQDDGASAGRMRWGFDANGRLALSIDGGPSIYTGYIPNNAGFHYALTRAGSDFRMFVDGTLSASATSSVSILQQDATIGGLATGDELDGYLNHLRFTYGVARYTSDFAVPSRAFPTTDGQTPEIPQ